MAFVGTQRALLAGSAFNPISLFQNGLYAGFLFDFLVPPPTPYPSGIYPAYQDQANTVANADTNPVGLLIDRSQGPALGAELLDGGGYVDAQWQKVVVGTITAPTIVAGVATIPRIDTSNYTYLYRSLSVTPGNVYKVSVRMLAGGDILLRSGSVPLSTIYTNLPVSHNATGTVYVRPTASTLVITLLPSQDGTSAVSDFNSGRLISGNHAWQATASAKPTIRLVNGKWRMRGDGSDDTLATPFKPGAAATVFAALAPDASAAGTDIALGSSDASNGRCYLGNADGVVVGGWGSLTTSSAGTDIRGSSAIACLTANASQALLEILYPNGVFETAGPFAASGTGSTTNGMALFANNANGTPGSFMKGDFLGMAINTAIADAGRRRATMNYFQRQF